MYECLEFSEYPYDKAVVIGSGKASSCKPVKRNSRMISFIQTDYAAVIICIFCNILGVVHCLGGGGGGCHWTWSNLVFFFYLSCKTADKNELYDHDFNLFG